MPLRAIHRLVATPSTLIGVVLTLAALLAGCGDKKDRPATQAAAKVNKEELTVHQVNAVLAQQRGLRPEQNEEASRRVLERLIDQELALQKATELKLDRDPRVVQAIEAARREIVARSYSERLGESASRPTSGEVKQYYEDNPALFRERRIYQFQEIAVLATPEQVATLRGQLQLAKTPAGLMQQLKAGGYRFESSQVVRAAEQVPLSTLPNVAKLRDGQALLYPTTQGATVLFVLASRLQPIDEERAASAIEQFLHNDRKRRLVADDLKVLRASAKIEYVGSFAGRAPSADAAMTPSVAEAAASAAASLEVRREGDGVVLRPHASAASSVEAADAVVKTASDADAFTIRKGLGLK